MDTIERIRFICKDRGIPISKLERECGFGNGYIRNKKTGKIPADRLTIIANYLHEDFNYLLTGQVHTFNPGDRRLWVIIDSYNAMNEQGKTALKEVAKGLRKSELYVEAEE